MEFNLTRAILWKWQDKIEGVYSVMNDIDGIENGPKSPTTEARSHSDQVDSLLSFQVIPYVKRFLTFSCLEKSSYLLFQFYTGYLGYLTGDPYRLINGYDSFGNVCGRDNRKNITGAPLSGWDMSNRYPCYPEFYKVSLTFSSLWAHLMDLFLRPRYHFFFTVGAFC